VVGARRNTGRLAPTILLDIAAVDWRGSLAGVLVTLVIVGTGILIPGEST
jgi:hypothetical protein